MPKWIAGVVVVALLGIGAEPSAQTQHPVPRTPWGHPDLQGRWTNATLTPLERPSELGSKEFFTEAEAAEYAKTALDKLKDGVKGLTDTGMMTDADALEAEVKRTMIAQAGESTLLVDRSKMLVRGLSVIASVAEVSNVIAHGLTTEEVTALRAARGSLRVLDEAG